MIQTRSLIERFNSEELKAVATAFGFLHQMGIFSRQAHENSLDFAQRMGDESPEELTKLIMQVQQTNRNLLALHEWAGTLKKEIEREQG